MLFLVHTTWSKVFWDNQNKLRKILLKDFFQIPLFWQYFFDNITPMKYRTKHKNKLIWQNYFSIFRGLKNNATCFFYKKYFYNKGYFRSVCTVVRWILGTSNLQRFPNSSKGLGWNSPFFFHNWGGKGS